MLWELLALQGSVIVPRSVARRARPLVATRLADIANLLEGALRRHARELCAEALACGMLLVADGARPRCSPALRARRGELLAAAELLWRAGVAGGEELRAAGETVTDLFWHACESGDFRPLADALADYGRVAGDLAARREARGDAP